MGARDRKPEERRARVLALLTKSSLTADVLSSRMGVARETVKHDVQALRAQGYRITRSGGDHSYVLERNNPA